MYTDFLESVARENGPQMRIEGKQQTLPSNTAYIGEGNVLKCD